MGENNFNSNNNSFISLSRNLPAALVVGAAGFIGSHLTDKLLEKNIQVIGVDNFKTGKKQNLEQAVKEKHFHLLETSAEDITVNFERLDYLFIVAEEGWNISPLLQIIKKYKPKVVFVSSVSLYDSKLDHDLHWYKEAEAKIAKLSKEDNINARVVRLAPIYGPRMKFNSEDSIGRLIKASISGELQKESTALEFSTRSLYVDDAVNLITKSVFSGSTAWKIYDGSLVTPIKIADVKQILMDPVWYENRGFDTEVLPPWPTPNALKTNKELSWEPKANLIKSLKETLSYFRENETEDVKQVKSIHLDWEEEKRRRLGEQEVSQPTTPTESRKEPRQEPAKKQEKLKKVGKEGGVSKKFWIAGTIIILYAFLYPIISLGAGVIWFKNDMNSAVGELQKGNFKASQKHLMAAGNFLQSTENLIASLSLLRKVSFFDENLKTVGQLIAIGEDAVDSSLHLNAGTESLYRSFKAISGEDVASPAAYLKNSIVELVAADSGFSKSKAVLASNEFNKAPTILKEQIENLRTKVNLYGDLVKKARTFAELLPQVVATTGKKSYLVLLQNNAELRPTGGFIGSVARIDFEGGKLKKIEVADVYALDGQLKLKIEPPKEIKEAIGVPNWFLRDSNWEPDFPTAARQAEWFYTKETGIRVDGVIAINLSAMENLLSVMGPLQLPDYNETVNADNLFEKAVAHSEQGFFPGSQAKKNFISALTIQLLNKIFFIPNQNWPSIISSIGQSVEQKQFLAYLDDPKLFSFIVSQNIAGVFPRAPEKVSPGVVEDFVSVIEANLGVNKANYYLERSLRLSSIIGKEGEISNRLDIDYINKSPSSVWPAGAYRNRVRVYLPFGSKVSRASWGSSDITSKLSTFVDYGRTVNSFEIILNPKEQKTLSVDWTLPGSLNFNNGIAKYQMDFIKQAGTLHDLLNWKINYPINYKVVENGTSSGKNQFQEYDVSTDLSKDRRFEISFRKK